jgi:phosphoribosylglycinamide formyltransferase-1
LKRIVILISGRGSNMAAVLAAEKAGELSGRIVAVISNRPEAAGLAIATNQGVPTAVINHKSYEDRQGFDDALSAAVEYYRPDLVLLAGFMRMLGSDFVARYQNRLINIHPSLLPAFPGLHTHRRALAEGVKIHGCTVHFVTDSLDRGPIVAQAVVPVREGDDEATLAARVLQMEHIVLPRAVRWFCEDRLVVDGNQVHIRPQTGSSPAEDGNASSGSLGLEGTLLRSKATK